MRTKAQFLVAVMLLILLTSTAWAFDGGVMQLPACTGEFGKSTSASFLPSLGGKGIFKGIRIERLDPLVTKIEIFISRSGQKGRLLYSGSVRQGQFIPLSTPNIVWTGYRSKNGCNGSAVYVRSIY